MTVTGTNSGIISNEQAKEIAYCIFADIADYIEHHPKEYFEFQKQEEKRRTVIYTDGGDDL